MGRKSLKLIFGGALALAGAALILSLLVGRYPIDFAALATGGIDSKVFFTLRLPRTIMAFGAGGALGVAGHVYQTLFSNPLASPDIIGISSGASVGAAAALLFWSAAPAAVTVSAFAGSFLAVGLVLLTAYLAGDRGRLSIVLGGIAINALANSLLMLMKLAADPEKQLAPIEFWTMGSFADITAQKLAGSLPFAFLGVAGLFLLRRQVLLLGLGDSEAKSLGVAAGPMRVLVLALATLATASVISVCGLIAFVGLLAPHAARLMTKNGSTPTMALSGVIGAALLLLADVAARSIGDAGVPVSIITSVIGAPLLLVLMAKGRRHE